MSKKSKLICGLANFSSRKNRRLKSAIPICFFVFLFFCKNVFASDYTSPLLRIFDGKTLKPVGQFLAFDKLFRGGGYVTVGNVAGKKDKEIIVGAGFGGSPQVRIFNKGGREIIPSFFPFASDFKGGVQIATGNVDGKGKDEIIISPSHDSQAWVKVYKSEIRKFKVYSNFLAYQKEFKGGLNLAACDLNFDGKDEIITAPAQDGGPNVRIFSGKGKDLGGAFMAYENDFRGGISIACGNVTGNKKPEIVTGPQSDRKTETKVYKVQLDSSQKRGKVRKVIQVNSFLAFPETFTGGVNLATGDADSDGKQEILAAVAGGGGPQVKIFGIRNYESRIKEKLLAQFFAYDKNFYGGVRLATGNLDGKKGDKIVVMPGAIYVKKCEKNCVALTFDDGYGAGGSFDSILNTLRARNVKATFFILGKAMQAYPYLMRRIVGEGHQLANHGYSHHSFTRISESQVRYEIEITDQLARDIAGKTTKPYFRYPYGAHNAATDAIIFNMGYKYYHWTASTADTSPPRSAQNSLWGALAGLHDSSIILAHTQSPHTAAVLDQIITAIQNAGYHLVTVAEMP